MFCPDHYFFLGAAFIFLVYVFLPFVFTLIGKLIYRLGFMKVGHYLVAMYSPYDVWLIDKCPYLYDGHCKVWTCPAYEKRYRYLCWSQFVSK